MEQTIHNRESWLTAFAKEVSPLIRTECGLTPSSYRISCGWPTRGGLSNKNQTIGQCCYGSVKGIREIFISPTLADADQVAHVVLHELLHAALPAGVGHRKPFSQAAKKVGLEGKPTATTASDELAAKLKAITDRLGAYPHDRIATDGIPKQTTRLLKAMCPVCGYIVRTTSKWIEEAGCPVCPQCSVEMQEAEAGAEASDPLFTYEQTVEFQIKAEAPLKGVDKRWSVRMHRKGKNIRWFVIDFGDDSNWPEVTLPRLTPADDRQNAIELIESLRAGLFTYEDIEVDDDQDIDDFDDYEGDPEADAAELAFLDDDEDEFADYSDGDLNPEEEAARALEQAKREAWVKV